MIFDNRTQAGALLARRLQRYRGDPNAIVIGLPRGGVEVAFAVARDLELPLDVMQVRKLGVPGSEEVAMGAIAGNGLCVLKAEVIELLGLPDEVIEAIAHRELREMERRNHLYRSARPAAKLNGHTVIVVDDGMATGATMLAAVKALRREMPARIVIAVPIAARECEAEVGTEADAFICLDEPRDFRSVGKWYRSFDQVTDDEVIDMLTEVRHMQLSTTLPPQPSAGDRSASDAR